MMRSNGFGLGPMRRSDGMSSGCGQTGMKAPCRSPGSLRGRPLWTGLVHAWFAGAKAAEQATEPPYDEFTPADNALLDEGTVEAIVEQVWPEGQETDSSE